MSKEISSTDIGSLDVQVSQLMQCKPLKEAEVKFLCEKVERELNKGKRDLSERKQRPSSSCSGYSMWRYSRPIP